MNHSAAMTEARNARHNHSLINADRLGTRSTRIYSTVSERGNLIPQRPGCCIGVETFFDEMTGAEVGKSLKFDAPGMR
jgi:hypothetical protein